MTWGQIKLLLDNSLSTYSSNRCKLLRKGKYTSGDHYKDGYIAMVYETLKELSPTDSMYPFDTVKTRILIAAYNRLTGDKVEDVWSD